MAEVDDRVRECLTPKVEEEVGAVMDPDDLPISIDG
jgi:hypothetical protein